jgi:hypothetical protein
LAGFLWGVLACAGYDAFRLPTIYAAHWWNDFFGSVGGWATASRSSFLVGYVWRYAGDGGGIAVVFFALAATLGAARWRTRTTIVFAVGYAVCPVWSGLVLTDLLAPGGRELFALSATTLVLSLVGHLIYGAILGLGYYKSRRLESYWPLQLALSGAKGSVFHTITADRHVAPSAPLAVGPVVVGPSAFGIAAGLQSFPGPIALCVPDDKHQRGSQRCDRVRVLTCEPKDEIVADVQPYGCTACQRP